MAERVPVLRREGLVERGGEVTKKPDRSAIDQIELMRNALALMLVGGFVFMIPLFVFKAIPNGNEQLITYMLGQLSGMALTALSFYYVNKVGQDALDAKRTENTGKALEAIKATAQASATGEPAAADIELAPGETATVAAEPDDK